MLKRFIASAALTLLCGAAATQTPETPVREERGNLILDGVPAPDPALMEQVDQYTASRGATLQGFLSDGGILISTRFGDVEQLHRVAAPLGAREQLTFFREPVTRASVTPTFGATPFVFLKDRGGDENAQIYAYSPSDHSHRLLTDGKSLHGIVTWSNDGKQIAYYSNGRDGVSYDVYIAAADGATPPRMVVSGSAHTWYPLDWSSDDRKLLLLDYVSIDESYLYIADTTSGALMALEMPPATDATADAATTTSAPPRAPAPRTASKPTSSRNNQPEKIGIQSARFAPSGFGIYLISDQDSEFAQLRYLDLINKQSRVLTTHIPWDIESFDVSRDGRYIAFAVNVDGASRVQIVDLQAQTDLVMRGIPSGIVQNLEFAADNHRLGMTIESAQRPRDVYVYDITNNETTRWTQSEVGPLDAEKFVTATLVRFPTWDKVNKTNRSIPAFVYRPRAPGPHPVLIDIHGGPESQHRAVFNAFTQYLVNELGYVVIAPNVRGSSGYGKSYLQLDNGKLREDAVRDIGALLVWIGLQGDLDAKRVVVSGGSYGGYMTLASVVSYSDRLRGGIDTVGISNFVTFLEKTSAYRRDLRRAEYGDERIRDMRVYLTRISPLTNAASIRVPLLVVQGLNDPRVPASESEQMVARIRSKGGEVWYLAARDEGHGFRKKANRDFNAYVVASFLKRLGK